VPHKCTVTSERQALLILTSRVRCFLRARIQATYVREDPLAIGLESRYMAPAWAKPLRLAPRMGHGAERQDGRADDMLDVTKGRKTVARPREGQFPSREL